MKIILELKKYKKDEWKFSINVIYVIEDLKKNHWLWDTKNFNYNLNIN